MSKKYVYLFNEAYGLGKELLGKDDAIFFDDIAFELEPDCACCEPNAELD